MPQFSLLSFRFCLFSEKERGKIELQSFKILHRKKKSFTSPFFICTQISRNQFVNLTSSLKRGRQIYISGFVCLAYFFKFYEISVILQKKVTCIFHTLYKYIFKPFPYYTHTIIHFDVCCYIPESKKCTKEKACWYFISIQLNCFLLLLKCIVSLNYIKYIT